VAPKKHQEAQNSIGPQTGSILINLVDGSRNPLPADVSGRRRFTMDVHPMSGNESTFLEPAAELVKELRYFNNLFDAYTVLVSAKGYEAAGWLPVHISPAKAATVDPMLLQEDAGWTINKQFRRRPVPSIAW
jgi:hypothetical protein